MKVMLDTHIYDRIVKTSGMCERVNELSAEGRLVILSTFVQEEELSAIPDANKRGEVQRIKTTKLMPAAGLYGLTPYGESPYGCDGADGGLPVDEVMSARGEHWQDAIIASTASAEADVLVTEDARLIRRALQGGIRCPIWTFDRFVNYVLHASGR